LTAFWRSPRIDGVGEPPAFAIHPRLAGNFNLAGRTKRRAADLDLTLSLVMAGDQAIWRDAG
jgi:hypothetical protein